MFQLVIKSFWKNPEMFNGQAVKHIQAPPRHASNKPKICEDQDQGQIQSQCPRRRVNIRYRIH